VSAFDADESPQHLSRYERVLSLIFSLRRWMMLGFSTLRGSNAGSPHHVYELRLYQWFIKAVFDDG
jgi:hypothetical protein